MLKPELDPSCRPASDGPSHYIIEVDGPGGRAFAICERIMLIRPEESGLPAGMVERLIGADRLSAAAVPTDGATWLRAAAFAQSADDPDDNQN